MATFLVTFLLAMSQGREEGWDSPYILSLFAIAFWRRSRPAVLGPIDSRRSTNGVSGRTVDGIAKLLGRPEKGFGGEDLVAEGNLAN